ncbi:MAG TPA: peptidoglycan DD-metalloendopeptidase family protein, partial [Acidimicrobiales bacterium]|nr:peptidoglycan DD-metalloendopeptidase family protein [Acidimicrobiales bacterium]
MTPPLLPPQAGFPTRRLVAWAAALFVPCALLIPTHAGAQEVPPAETSTTTSSTSSTTTTSTTLPPVDETTTTTAPPPPPQPPANYTPDDDAITPNDVPTEQVVVPPSPTPIPPTPVALATQRVIGVQLRQAQRQLDLAFQQQSAAQKRVSSAEARVFLVEAQIARLSAEKLEAVTRLLAVRDRLKRQAVGNYIGSSQPVNSMLDADDVNDLVRRVELLRTVMHADRARVASYEVAKAAAGTGLEQLVAELDRAHRALETAKSGMKDADTLLFARNIQVSAAKAGGVAALGGFVFPVAGPHSFADTFGAPRMFGTPYAHLHQGNDIFAAQGTPLVACERGVVIRVGTDLLGGTKLWLVGASGTRYYYAHLSAYAPEVVEGLVVNAGQIVGFVGNTGNALTTPAHLHFEIHPNGGEAVDPYPILRAVDEAAKQIAAGPAVVTRKKPYRALLDVFCCGVDG